MLNAEEIAIKLNIDVSDAEKMRKALTTAGKEGHSSFIHTESAAKGFKKTLHELANESPILGNALRLAISPVGGMFAIAASSVAFFKGKIDELNKSLDEMGRRNAQPIGTDRSGRGISAFFRGRENSRGLSEDLADKRGQAAKDDALSPLQLLDKAIKAEAEWKDAHKKATSEAFEADKAAIIEKAEMAKQKVRDLTDVLKSSPTPLTDPFSEGQQSIRESVKKRGFWKTFGSFFDVRHPLSNTLGGGGGAEGSSAYSDLLKTTSELRTYQHQLEVLNGVEKENNHELERKKTAWDQAYNAFVKAYPLLNGIQDVKGLGPGSGSPNQAGSPWHSPAGSSIDNNNIILGPQGLDALTGGIPYNPITLADGLDKLTGGIKYNPIKGAPGYGPKPVAVVDEITITKLTRDVLSMVKAQLESNGIIVTGKD